MTDTLYTRVQDALSSLQLMAMGPHLDALTQQAAAGNWSALEYLDQLTQLEVNARFERDVQRKMRLARLPFFKTLDQFDFAFQPSVNERQIRDLAGLRFIANTDNILFLGPPGVGKTQPEYYPHKFDIVAGRNGDGDRSATAPLWPHPALAWRN